MPIVCVFFLFIPFDFDFLVMSIVYCLIFFTQRLWSADSVHRLLFYVYTHDLWITVDIHWSWSAIYNHLFIWSILIFYDLLFMPTVYDLLLLCIFYCIGCTHYLWRLCCPWFMTCIYLGFSLFNCITVCTHLLWSAVKTDDWSNLSWGAGDRPSPCLELAWRTHPRYKLRVDVAMRPRRR